MALAHSERIGRALCDVIIPYQNSPRVQPPKKPKIEAYALPQINPAPRSKEPQTLPKWHHKGNHLMSRFWTYENKLVILFTLGGGIAALDAQALFYLMPFVADDLKLNNAQAGLLASLVLITWSISGFLVGNFADKSGKRKTCLVTAFILFGLCSFLTGLAASFTMLLAVRALIGLAEGPVIPVAQSIMAEESSPHRRGLNMGLVQNFGSQLVGSFISPLLLIAVATAYSWHAAFYFAGVPALLIALLTALVLRPAPRRSPASQSASANAPSTVRQVLGLLKFSNIRLCMLVSCCIWGWYFLILTFLPLYCVRVLQMSGRDMSIVMSALGAAGVVAAIVVPYLSDRVGRRPIMALFAAVGAIAPLGALYFGGATVVVGALLFVGCLATGIGPLYMSTVPLETVSARDSATAVGLIMGFGQIVGGFFGPAFAGILADRFGLAVPLWAAVAAALVAAITCLFLKETAPAKTGRLSRPLAPDVPLPLQPGTEGA